MFEHLREEFPILSQQVHQKPLIYFDNAASTQKPISVINSVTDYYETINSNVHRGVHHLSQLATDAYEQARLQVQHFIRAKHPHEVIFTRGTTESINLVACSFARELLKPGDEIILSMLEHHSNIVPWQLACEQSKAVIKVVPINEKGELILDEYRKLFSEKTKIVAITQTSNALGTINPIKEITDIAHANNVPVLIDGAQGIKSCGIDVQAIDCDFYCFSGHKMYGPMGVGVLYGKEAWLEKLPPYQGGGEMIQRVTFAHTTFNELPFKFEAGTPNVADVIGLKSAIDYLNRIGISTIAQYENELLEYGAQQLLSIPGLSIIGKAKEKASIISFILDRIHPYDAGLLIDKWGIAVRTGHHCAQPIMDKYGIPGTIRASFALYNTKEEIDRLVDTIKRVQMMLL